MLVTVTVAVAILGVQPGAALISAAERGDVVVVEQLLEEGVEPDSRNSLGTTALMLASQAGGSTSCGCCWTRARIPTR